MADCGHIIGPGRRRASADSARYLAAIGGALLTTGAALAHPAPGIIVMPDGGVCFVDGVRSRIYRIDPEGKVGLYYDDKGRDLFRAMHHIVPHHEGYLYAASDDGTRIWLIHDDGSVVPAFPPPDGPELGFIGFGGAPFTLDARLNIYCVNTRYGRHSQILRIDRAGRIGVFAGGRWGDRDGTGEEAEFRELHGSAMIFARDGSMLLTDNGTRVRRIHPDGIVTTVAGAAREGFVDGVGGAARFHGASGLALDPGDNIFVADTENRAIRMITPQGRVTTYAANPEPSRRTRMRQAAHDEAERQAALGRELDRSGGTTTTQPRPAPTATSPAVPPSDSSKPPSSPSPRPQAGSRPAAAASSAPAIPATMPAAAEPPRLVAIETPVGVAVNNSFEVFVLDYREESERPRVFIIPPDGPARLAASID